MPAHQLTRPIVAIKPLVVPTTGRDIELEVKVTAPASGQDLPVIVFSHGNAWSMDGYGPLVDRWAAAGFVVVQPTHLDSRRYGIGFDDPRFQAIWRARVADLHAVLDTLDDLLAQAGGLDARADRSRIAVVGHSWGAGVQPAGLGAALTQMSDQLELLAEKRIQNEHVSSLVGVCFGEQCCHSRMLLRISSRLT